MTVCRVLQQLFDQRALCTNRTDDASDTDVRPDDRCLRMPFEQVFQKVEINGRGSFFRKRSVDVIVQNHNETDFGAKVEDLIESRILQTRYAAAMDLR